MAEPRLEGFSGGISTQDVGVARLSAFEKEFVQLTRRCKFLREMQINARPPRARGFEPTPPSKVLTEVDHIDSVHRGLDGAGLEDFDCPDRGSGLRLQLTRGEWSKLSIPPVGVIKLRGIPPLGLGPGIVDLAEELRPKSRLQNSVSRETPIRIRGNDQLAAIRQG